MASLKKCKIVFIFVASTIALCAVILQFRGANMTCIFCDIVDKKTDTQLLYEDDVKVVSLALLTFRCNFHF